MLREEYGVKDLEAEVKKLKGDVEKHRSKLAQTEYHYRDLQAKYDELKIKADMQMEMQKSVTVAASTQTEPMTGARYVEQMDWDFVNERAERYKRHYFEQKAEFDQHKAKFKALEQKYENTKTICNGRFKALEENKETIIGLRREIDELKRNETEITHELNALKQRFEQAQTDTAAYKQLKETEYNELIVEFNENVKKCNKSIDLLREIQAKYGLLKEEFKRVKIEKGMKDGKYEQAKEMLNGRFDYIGYLQEKLRENRIEFEKYFEKKNDENVPINK